MQVYTHGDKAAMLDRFPDWTLQLAKRLPSAIPHALSRAIPSSCILCGSSGDTALCNACDKHFLAAREHRCRQCGLPVSPGENHHTQRCGTCLAAPRAFDTTIVVTDYAAPLDQLVLALKFGSRLALAPLFARLLHQAIQQADMPMPELLTAVPLGDKRLAERGFNQALEIARPLARMLAIPLEPQLLARTRETLMQSRLHPDERHRNIRQAFVPKPHAMQHIQGRHVAVVDDVMTTGETLNEVAATLKRCGASRVTNLVFARTPLK
ncbi:MAG TPA: ComF family protein [Oxalicibacterium sp.]